MSDPRLDGILLAIHREGETADPYMEAEAVGRGLAYRVHGRIYLTAAGDRRLRDARLL